MARPAKKQRAIEPPSDDEETDYSSDAGAAASNKKKGKGKNKPRKRGRPSKNQQRSDDDDDEDDSQDSDDDEGGGGKSKRVELNDAEKKEHIQAIVRYVLFNELHRRVLKREDIVKNVLTDGRGRHFNSLMPKVQKILREVMGMELILLRPRETATGKNPPKAWMLRSTLPQPLLRHAAVTTQTGSTRYAAKVPFEFDRHAVQTTSDGRKTLRQELGEWMIEEAPLKSSKNDAASDDDDEEDDDEAEGGVMRDAKREEGAAYGVLGTILALILVNGRVLGDDQLISYLLRLNLTPTSPIPLNLSSPHPESVTLAAYLTLLTKQQYLERSKTAGAPQGGGGGATQTQAGRSQGPSRTQRATAEGIQESGDPSIEWRWGARAEAEVGEEGVARFVQYVFEHGDNTRQATSLNKRKKQKGRRGDDDDEDENESGGGRKRGKTGEKFLTEVARAAGVKQLQKAEKIEGGGFN
ncbi:hypothetical protein JCM3766R1_003275 [Sporobolomyces carnicolor]